MTMKKRIDGAEQPYIPFGIFKIRLPFVHYRLEFPEMLQAVLLIAVGLSAIPVLQQTLGMTYDVALTVVALAEFLNLLHITLGDPVVPGWIASALPLVLVFLGGYKVGPDSVHALMALQILVAVIFIVMGTTGAAHKLISAVPNSLKAGILLGAGLAAINREFKPDGDFFNFPISISIGALVTFFILFSMRYKILKSKNNIFLEIGKYGMLPGLLVAMIVGPIVGELAIPKIEWGFIHFHFGEMIANYSPWGIGFPSAAMFISAIPMAIAVYIITFGEIVTADVILREAAHERPDEKIDFDSNRMNIITGIRNLILSLICPFTPLAGPLWAAISIAICERYKEGRKAVDSIFSSMGSFRISAVICVTLLPVTTLCKPVLPIALALTLLVQGFACSYIAFEMVRDNKTAAGIAGCMAAIIAMRGVTWGLGIGVVLFLLLEHKDKAIKPVEISRDVTEQKDLEEAEG